MSDLLRIHTMSERDFVRDHLIPRVPVVVTGEVSRWPAFHLWTWKYLVARFGPREVDLFDDWFVPTGVSTFAGFVTASIGVPEPDPACAFVRWFARNAPGDGRWADDVFAALASDWVAPSFLPDRGYVVPYVGWSDRVSAVHDPFPYRGLFVSARGARTRLHLDPWGSSAVLCQVAGTKRVAMYAPARHEAMLRMASEEGGLDRLGQFEPDLAGELHAGELLFVPAGWWHQVDTLTDSVSLTWNFLHATVAERLRTHVASHPDDPDLGVVAYFLSGLTPTDAPQADVTALVSAAINALGERTH